VERRYLRGARSGQGRAELPYDDARRRGWRATTAAERPGRKAGRIYILRAYILEAAMQVAKWGNSLAVRLPSSVVEALELKEGDEVEIHVLDGRDFGVARKPGREELLRRLRAFRGRLPADFKFDRDEANAR
jgi:antitoxin MazE